METLFIELGPALAPLFLFVLGTIIKGPIRKVEIGDAGGANWTDLGPFISEGLETPKEEPQDLGMGDGTDGQGGVKLLFAVPVIESDADAAKLGEAKTAAGDFTKRPFRFTTDTQVMTTEPCRVRMAPAPVQAFGSVGVMVIRGTATGSEPGSTYSLAAV